jgi:hypothetical protein
VGKKKNTAGGGPPPPPPPTIWVLICPDTCGYSYIAVSKYIPKKRYTSLLGNIISIFRLARE